MKAQTVPDTSGLVPAISLRLVTLCFPYRDCRDIRAFTPVFAGFAKPITFMSLPGLSRIGLWR